MIDLAFVLVWLIAILVVLRRRPLLAIGVVPALPFWVVDRTAGVALVASILVLAHIRLQIPVRRVAQCPSCGGAFTVSIRGLVWLPLPTRSGALHRPRRPLGAPWNQ